MSSRVSGMYLNDQASDISRQATRTTLFIRPVKLATDKGEFFCVIRDISRTGISVRCFHPLPAFRAAEIEFETGDRFQVELIWAKGGDAGLQFEKEVDLQAITNELGAFRRRPLRFGLTFPVTLARGGERVTAQVENISQQGARITTSVSLALHETVRIEGVRLPTLIGKVLWRKGQEHGLVLDSRLSMKELAEFAAILQCPQVLDFA